MVDFDLSSTWVVTGWGGCSSGQRWYPLWGGLWSWLWSLLSALVGRRCTSSFGSTACPRIFYRAMGARKAFVPVVLTKHSRMSIPAFTMSCPGNSTPCFVYARTLARGFLFSYCVSSIAERENPSLAILAMFKARCKSDCSNCTRPPGLAMVADRLNTSKKLVAASKIETWLVPQPCMLP